MRVLFCGGGTAGHITPALAIAEEIGKRYHDSYVAFVGRLGGNENTMINAAGYKLYEINVRGFSRSFGTDNLKAVKLYFDAKRKAKTIINEFKPDAVIGTGGYVCAPVISAAVKSGIFTLIHESNATLGLTTKILAGKCDHLLLGTDIKTRFKNAQFVGNPTSDKFGSISKATARRTLEIPMNKKMIVSVGGSIGAGKLNDAAIGLMRSFVEKNDGVYHVHSAGKRYFDELKSRFPELCRENAEVKILPFIDNMPLYLAAADLLVCRCGAMTLAEAARSGCPTVMIPSPNVTADHQMKNAIGYRDAGTGVILTEAALTAQSLKNTVRTLLSDRAALEKMSQRAKSFYAEDPKKRIVDLIEANIG